MGNRKQIRSISGLFGWTGVTFLSGFIVALGITLFFSSHTFRNVDFPVNWWFPAFDLSYIWFSFYLIKGFAAWLIWRKLGTVILGGPINWYVLHLIASVAATSLLFFLPVPSGLLMHALVIFITFLFTAWKFYQKVKVSGLILIPNMLWLIYILAYYAFTVF